MFNPFRIGAPNSPSGAPVNPSIKHLHCQESNVTVEYQLLLSARRRTLSLEVKQGQIRVRAPLSLPQADIDAFLQKKQHWLQQVLDQQAIRPQRTMHFEQGDNFYYLGQKCELRLESGARFRQVFQPESGRLTLVVPESVRNVRDYVRTKFKTFLRQECERQVMALLAPVIERTGLKPKDVEFKFYKRRWGCCYRNGLVRINPCLVSAPTDVIECVLIHELCHLEHMDHSKHFWSLNQQYCGRCNQTDAWLKQYGQAILLE